MSQASKSFFTTALVASALMISCGTFSDAIVWVKTISFQVNQNANGGTPFVCHVVIPYQKDMDDKISAMDAKAYFNDDISKSQESNPNIQIFKFDLIPGKNVVGKKVKVKSYSKARGAYLFVKYSKPGKFTANISASSTPVVKCTINSIQILNPQNLSDIFGPDAK